MKAKICDRCGGTYTTNNLYKTRITNPSDHIGGISFMTYDYKRDDIVDLCDFCIGELFKFLNNEPEEK